MQRVSKGFLMVCVMGLFIFISHGQQGFRFHNVKFRQLVRLPVGSKEGQLFVKVHPNKMVISPKLLPPDADGNFWIMGEAKGRIMKVKRSGEVITVLRPPLHSIGLPSINSSGHLAFHVRKGEGYNYIDEIHIYSPEGQRLAAFKVKDCPKCKHPYLHEMMGLDDKGRIWLRFLSSDRTVEEDPNQKACTVAFDIGGRVLQHVEGAWGLDIKGRLRRRTKSIGGNYVILDPETMQIVEIPVPAGWDGLFIGVDPKRELIWWSCWRLDNPKIEGVMAFGKQGIVAILPRPSKFLGAEAGKEILSYQVEIGADGRLYVSQCTEEAFYIFEADMSFLKR